MAIGLYYSKNQSTIGELLGPTAVINSLEQLSNVSYSFYMAIGALVCCVANVVVGSLIGTNLIYATWWLLPKLALIFLVCLADKCL